jgi:hypothetical protein
MPKHTNTEDRYTEAQIYKVFNPDCDDVYIGSTNYKHLSKRYWRHKRDGLDERYKHRYGKIFDTDNHRIEQVEAFPCRNKEELRNRERYWIEHTPHTINSQIPILSREQTLEKNRARQKAWYQTEHGKMMKKKSNERFKLKNPNYYPKKKADKLSGILLEFD